VTKPTFDTARVEEALREAALRARHGTREERAGKFLGKQAAVENAVTGIYRQKNTSRG
jgi:hypothetical protein